MTTITSTKVNISEIQWENRQPEELDYLRPNGFRFLIQSLPKVTYFCQAANIPNISLGTTRQPTPLIDIRRPGEKLDFGDLTIKFMIQKDMTNYIELYNWMVALGFPENHSQFRNRSTEQRFRNPDGTPELSSTGVPQIRSSDATDFSDASLLVLDGNRNPVVSLNFLDCYPIALSGVDFDITLGDTQYFTAQASFGYRIFTIQPL